jgi:hypothetical protein
LGEAAFGIAGLHHGNILHGTLRGLRHRNQPRHARRAATLAAGRAGRAGNRIRDNATHRVIGAAGAACADAEELRRLSLREAR